MSFFKKSKLKIDRFCYKWLPIIFGCHCKPERSFFYKGKQFPICARCTGELIGIILGLILIPIVLLNNLNIFGISSIFENLKFYGFLLIPMLIDGFSQQLTSRESNYILRVVTGFLFGFGITGIVILTTVYTFELGQSYAKYIK